MPSQAVLVCTAFSADSNGVTSCSAQSWQQTYVLPPDAGAQIELLINGGFDPTMFLEFFGGTLLVFIAGLTAGLIVSQVRKVQRI